jgi:CubicO group peptidase (beta-lactamase class C family)
MKSARIAITLLTACTQMPAHAANLEVKVGEFAAFMREHRREKKIVSLSYAVVVDGRIVAAEGLGWQDHDAEEPTTKDTTYLAASITKTFTGATLLGMEADGIIDLDDDFTTLSDWRERCEALRQAGSIFGGGGTVEGVKTPTLDCATRFSLRQVLQHQALGAGFMYNPVLYGRLANWVEERTKRPWIEWVDRYVLDPAGLADTAAGWRDERKAHVIARLAPPFRFTPGDEDGVAPSPLPNPELNASSGIISSAVDLARYSIALDEGRVLSPGLRELMWAAPHNPDGSTASYANGWWVQRWKGHRLVWHGGWWPDAYAGLLLKAPDDRAALIVLGNTDGLNWPNSLFKAEVEKSPVAAKFLELFVASE